MGRPKGSINKKSIWLMESLAQHGYDYEKMLTGFLQKAAKGDRLALDMAHLLVKLVPYLANMPKTDTGTLQIDTLVINRFEPNKHQDVIDTQEVTSERSTPDLESQSLTEGNPPLTTP
jgi:hypothetical protein